METRISEDRRHLERFSLRAHAIVQTTFDNEPREVELVTENVSSGGAYFPMEAPFNNGEQLKVTLFLSVSAFGTDAESRPTAEIVTRGRVVRTDPRGMAVQFVGRYSMSPVGEERIAAPLAEGAVPIQSPR